MNRSHSLDLIKGIAVLVMIFANTSVYFFNFIDFNFIRLICSFAAPVFLILTGYFTQLNLLKNDINKSILTVDSDFYRFQILYFFDSINSFRLFHNP